jgi:rhodanese-related sulfurtransferase
MTVVSSGRRNTLSQTQEMERTIVDTGIEGRNPRRRKMPTSVKQMMEAANAVVPKITPAEAREMIAKGNTLVVDVRDAPELEKSGKIAGAVHHSRGMLEFRADPDSPYYDKNFAKDKSIIDRGELCEAAGAVAKRVGVVICLRPDFADASRQLFPRFGYCLKGFPVVLPWRTPSQLAICVCILSVFSYDLHHLHFLFEAALTSFHTP